MNTFRHVPIVWVVAVAFVLGAGVWLTYLTNGNLMATMGATRWFSNDFGKTWTAAPVNGKFLNEWDPQLVEKDPATGRPGVPTGLK